ncbi:MAG: AbrB/MazE/SpoVT family DNA-binding domain-containing protein [Clostridia bacterium]|nr:AbrB/MazE/SpoVT family DNA-binding domain-containing protein [Clostridia bacterium]
METAKIFENGRSQAVRLPKKYRFSVNEVIVQRMGSSLILTPKEKIVDTFLSSLNEFTDDFMSDGRYTGTTDEREAL